MQRLHEYYKEIKPEFARLKALGGSQTHVLLATTFNIDTKSSRVDELRTVLTARTWDDDFSFWTIDLHGRRMIVKSDGQGWAVWRGINLGCQSKSIAYSDSHNRARYSKKIAKVNQEQEVNDSDSSEDDSNGRPAQAPEARVTRASVRGRQDKRHSPARDTSQALVGDSNTSKIRDKPSSNSTNSTQAGDTGAKAYDRQDHALPRPTDTSPPRFNGVHISSSQDSPNSHSANPIQADGTVVQLCDDENHPGPAPADTSGTV
ncbi:MAG: hypothetical protein Q9203_005972 [Teloschistes exilis]